MSRSEKPNSICIGNMIFQSKETGEKFCLNKKRRDEDLAKLACDGCLCGEENKPTEWKWAQEKKPDWQRTVEQNKTQRIVGGEYTGENQYPWFALIFLNYTNLDADLIVQSKLDQRCGGSLITEKVILSAGHCVDGDIL